MGLKRSVRIVKKVQEDGRWKFASLERRGSRYVWDARPGAYFLDWWEGIKRKREYAGKTPSQALTAQRRKQNELAGAFVLQHGEPQRPAPSGASDAVSVPRAQPPSGTPLGEGKRLFLAHIAAHSPDKPEIVRRYRQVIEHFERLVSHRRFIEEITRADRASARTG